MHTVHTPYSIRMHTHVRCLRALPACAACMPQVVAVYEALEKHGLLVYAVFYYYAILGKSFKGSDRVGHTEIDYIHLNAFYTFVADCGLATDAKDLNAFSVAWSIVDAKDRTTAALCAHNVPGALCRHEWLQLVVRMAVITQLTQLTEDGDRKSDVAWAVDTFCANLTAELPLVLVGLVDGNRFRSMFCYQEATDLVLRQNEPLLRALFASYAALANNGMNDALRMASTSRMCIGEWLEFVSNVGLVQLGLVSLSTAMRAFSLAQIRSSHDHSHTQEMRLRQLSFEDFLEAIVRLAYVCALPTLDEVHETGAADGGDFLLALATGAEGTFRQFIARRTGSWLEQPRQRIHRCLSMLMALVARLVEANAPLSNGQLPADVRGGGSLSKALVGSFVRHRSVNASALRLPAATFDGSKIASVMQEIEAHNNAILSGVPAFSGLSAPQIKILLGAMSVAKFKQGEYVFEQGAHGDAFYLITCGQAAALRTDPNDPSAEEQTIAQLGESDCFGELALLRNEPRAASILATSTALDVLFVTRAAFEAKLGPLSDFQLAKYDGVVHSEGVEAEELTLVQDAAHVLREIK